MQILERNVKRQIITTRDLTLSSALAAVYILTTFVPLSTFIGGAGFVPLAILIVPVIAALQRPRVAAITTLAGALGMPLFQTGFYPVFGIAGILIPVVAAVLGSFAFHYKPGAMIPWAYVLAGAGYYLLFSKGTLLWLAPYLIVLVSLPLVLRLNYDPKAGSRTTSLLLVGLLTLYTAISEQVTMNVLSISLLGLVGVVWSIITPLMFLERSVATIGGTALIVALKSRLGARLPGIVGRRGWR